VVGLNANPSSQPCNGLGARRPAADVEADERLEGFRDAEPIDDEVRDRIIRRLASPKLQAKLAERAEGRLTVEEAREVRATVQADRAKLAQLEALAADLDPAVVEATRTTIGQRMLENSRRLRAGVHHGPLAGLPDTEAALRRAWRDWSIDRRREVIAEMVERITLPPVGRGRRANPEDHILVDFKL